MYASVNPATEECVRTFPEASPDEVERALARAARGYETWRRTTAAERARVLRRVADLLDRRAPDLARLAAEEMGKPVTQGEAEVGKCAVGCRWYADHAERLLAPERRESDGTDAFVRFDSLGPLLAIMPWNFPFWQVLRFAAPALAAGNVVVLKHAPSVPRCALSIEALLREAGLPGDAFVNLFLTNEQTAAVIADPRVRGVTLTGSPLAGRAVAAAAGASLKPSVMELGGSDACIVFSDADLVAAVGTGVLSRCANSGQSCIAAKRFLVERTVYERFTDRLVEAMAARVVGDPLRRDVEIGPLARRDLRDGVADQVARTLKAGGRALCGGRPREGRGFYFPPTVLVDAPPDSPARVEEIFAPVATVIPFGDEEEALRIANGTVYGLGASLWTSEPARAARLVPRIEAGSVFVNGLVKSDPRLPFGGVKDSGYGRELAVEGLRAWVNVKTVWIK